MGAPSFRFREKDFGLKGVQALCQPRWWARNQTCARVDELENPHAGQARGECGLRQGGANISRKLPGLVDRDANQAQGRPSIEFGIFRIGWKGDLSSLS